MNSNENCYDSRYFYECDRWSELKTIHTNFDISSGLACTQIIMKNEEVRNYIFFISPSGKIYYKYRNSSNEDIWSPDTEIPDISGVSIKDISAINYRGSILLGYRSNNGMIYQKVMLPDGTWSSTTVMRDENGNPIFSGVAPSFAIRPYYTADLRDISIIHMAYTDPQTKSIQIRYFDELSGRWLTGVYLSPDEGQLIDIWIKEKGENRYFKTVDKIGFSWRPDSSIRKYGGRFYMLYTDASGTNLNFQYLRYSFMSYDVESNSWKFFANGTIRGRDYDILSKRGVDMIYFNGNGLDNVSAVYIDNWGGESGTKYVGFIPYADGIVNMNIKDFNDWEVINKGVCISLHRPIDGADDSCSYCGSDIYYCYGIENCCRPLPPPPLEVKEEW